MNLPPALRGLQASDGEDWRAVHASGLSDRMHDTQYDRPHTYKLDVSMLLTRRLFHHHTALSIIFIHLFFSSVATT